MTRPDDYDATVNAAGLCDLSSEGWVRCEGPGARPFLQRLLANEVLKLEVGQGRRSLLLDVKGKVAADLAVLRTAENELSLEVPEAAREPAVKMLQLYGIADPLETTDATAERTLVTIQGPRSREALSTITTKLPELTRELDHATVELDGVPARVVRHDRSGLGGFDVLVFLGAVDSAKAVAALERAVRQVGGGRLSTSTLDVLRLEAGRPSFGADFGPETIPQEARLEEPSADALSFDKGCFLGQEVVARLRFRGHVNRLLVGLELPSGLAPGTPLFRADKEVGRVTSWAASPRLARVVGLGYARREHTTPGTELEARPTAGEKVTVRVTTLPFPERSA